MSAIYTVETLDKIVTESVLPWYSITQKITIQGEKRGELRYCVFIVQQVVWTIYKHNLKYSQCFCEEGIIPLCRGGVGRTKAQRGWITCCKSQEVSKCDNVCPSYLS